ncbi:uncharacterized protein N7484_005860 [Penicillium longicatenatum]|uniref:uncharacterized protein n=1 Tax=Penicillium longicatenatum TaxID=1561947 RepID=UPI0025476F62|nr:uncharacterized protein N7484_005860 [Penicillium longicatenatum]KAJ5643353.1 hypothetical protein N7484_005860 [Penicillium longicatenatum]
MQSENPFRVIIVGGSVAGLTLAHCLGKSNIEYVVLESHCEIAPEVGASIGILPNGARTLDQLGVFDDILDVIEPLVKGIYWTETGQFIVENDVPRIIHNRHGYAISFFDRRALLEILYNRLGDNQNRVHTSKKVVKVEHLPTKVLVHCDDQSVIEGDIVVGADGVRSTVRQQMWHHMESIGMKKEVKEEKAIMSSEYSCVFGISTATPGLLPGECHRTYGKDYSSLTIVGKNGRVFWFLFTKLDKVYKGSEIPRYSEEDMEKQLAQYSNKPITDKVPFSSVLQNTVTKSFLALEEAYHTKWCMDRFVCIGDSAHKMTPNMGQGGNNAVESAASLANHLTRLVQSSSNGKVPFKDIKNCLTDWQTARQPRAKEVCIKANALTRLEACATLKDRLMAIHALPHLASWLVERLSQSFSGAERLDCVPLPPRALNCPMPIHEIPEEDKDTLWRRAISASPLIGCAMAARSIMGSAKDGFLPHLIALLRKGIWTSNNGETVSLTRSLYNFPFLDRLFSPLITCFLPSISGSDAVSRSQMVSFLADCGPVYTIWLLESHRQGKSGLEVILPIVAGIAFQLKGIGKIAPIYFAIEYIRSPLSSLKGDNRNMKTDALKSLLPAVLAGYYLPTFANFFASTVESRQSINAVWQLFPLVVPVIQIPLRLLAKPRSNIEAKEKTASNHKTNMLWTRCTYGSLAAISGLSFIYARWSAPQGASLATIFLPGLFEHAQPVTSFAQGIARFLQYDEIFSLGAGFIWLGLRFRELQQSGVPVSWWKSACALVGTTVTLGPGAALALGWGWREEALAKTHAIEDK